MKELVEGINKLVKDELFRANKKFGSFNNFHEAYAVIKEEIEETGMEFDELQEYFEFFWCGVKCDVFNDDILKQKSIGELIKMHFTATQMAAEACQVAAMIQKTINLTKYLPKNEFKSTIDIEPKED